MIKTSEKRDYGLTSSAPQEGIRLLNSDGSFNVLKIGNTILDKLRIYHRIIEASWSKFFFFALCAYLGVNLIFTLLYFIAGAAGITEFEATLPQENHTLFIHSLYFSLQTFTTIDYGIPHPKGHAINLLVCLQSWTSMIFNAIVTGSVFARFARPKSTLQFSRIGVIAPYQGKTAFMFRIVDSRSVPLINGKCRVLYAWFEKDASGRNVRRFADLKLERDTIEFLPVHWVIVHPIDDESPLNNITPDALKEIQAEFLVSFAIYDELSGQEYHVRTSYEVNEIIWNKKFVPMFDKVPNNDKLVINMEKLDLVEDAPC